MDISVWNMEDARMERNGRFQEWSGRQSGRFQAFKNGFQDFKISKFQEQSGRFQDFKNGRFQEWSGKQSSILPYQFYARFCALYLQKNTYRCRVVINNIVTKVFNINIYAYYLSTNRGTLVVSIAQTGVYVQHHCKYFAIRSIDVIVDDFDRFDFFFF